MYSVPVGPPRILLVKSAQDTANWDTKSDEDPSSPGPRHAGHGASDPGAGPSRTGAEGGGKDSIGWST